MVGTWVKLVALVLLSVPLVACSHATPGERAACTLTVAVGASIQEVLDAAPPGAVICLPAGTWTENLRISRPVTLQGAGQGRTRVEALAAGQPAIEVVLDEGQVSLVGITFAGARGDSGLSATSGGTLVVRECAFADNARDGVHARGSGEVLLAQVTLSRNSGHGLRAQDGIRIQVSDSILEQNRGGGVWLSGPSHLILLRSELRNNEGYGLWIRDDAVLVAAESRIAHTRGHGLWVQNRGAAELAFCAIEYSLDIGLLVDHASRAIVTDSRIDRALCGVDARASSQVALSRSRIREISWDGIRLSGSVEASISGCTVSDGKGTGVRIMGAARAEMEDNHIASWGSHGILSLGSSEPTGSGNLLSANGVDMAGNLPGTLRTPRRASTLADATYPDPRFGNLQEAVDAVVAGGRLVIESGVHRGGITIDKPITIESSGGTLLLGHSGADGPVVSLVGGAECHLIGLSLAYGSEGLVIGADAVATLTDCVIADNLEGIRLSEAGRVLLIRCRVSRNERAGIWLWGASVADIVECVFTTNGIGAFGVDGPSVGVGATARVHITRSTITGSGRRGAVFLRDSGGAELWDTTIESSSGWGIVLIPCTGARYTFTGWVEGGRNTFTQNKVDVCPDALSFLSTEGGRIDFRH